jgi:hypothetical protein
MANLTKKRIVDIQIAALRDGDILTKFQASNIGWMALRRVGLECVTLPQDDTSKRFVRLQPLSIEVSGCTA